MEDQRPYLSCCHLAKRFAAERHSNAAPEPASFSDPCLVAEATGQCNQEPAERHERDRWKYPPIVIPSWSWRALGQYLLNTRASKVGIRCTHCPLASYTIPRRPRPIIVEISNFCLVRTITRVRPLRGTGRKTGTARRVFIRALYGYTHIGQPRGVGKN